MRLVRNQKQAPLPERQQSTCTARQNISSTDGSIFPLSLRQVFRELKHPGRIIAADKATAPQVDSQLGGAGRFHKAWHATHQKELTETSIQPTTSAPRRAPSILLPPFSRCCSRTQFSLLPFIKSCNDDQPHPWKDQTPAASELHIPPS